MGLKWVEPPANKGPHGKWADIANELRARPNEWAVVATNVSLSYSSALRSGSASGWTRGEFEVRTVGSDVNRGRGDIYARFIGGA